MADPLIQNVSDTAFMVAVYRAMETERSDALFRDPLAAKLQANTARRLSPICGAAPGSEHGSSR